MLETVKCHNLGRYLPGLQHLLQKLMHFEPVLDSSELPGQTMRLTVGKSSHIHIVQMSTAGKEQNGKQNVIGSMREWCFSTLLFVFDQNEKGKT